ncbi:hypothetical protein P9112_000652 [Eukaryota sp. TZLM1-RC]
MSTNLRGKERIGYCILLVLNLVLALFLRSRTVPFFDIPIFGPLAVFRVFFAAALFYTFLALFVLKYPEIQEGHWKIKVLMLILFTMMSAFMPSNLFVFYGRISQFVGGFFLFCSIIYLIDFSYTINQKWISKAEEEEARFGQTRHYLYNFILSSLIILGSLIFIIVLFNLYESCQKLSTVLVFAIIFIVISVVSSITSPDASIFGGAIVICYIAFLSFSCMSALREPHCNPFYNDEEGNKVAFYTSVAIAIFSISYCCINTSWNSAKRDSDGGKRYGTATMGQADEVESQSEDSEEEPCYSYTLFNSTMIAACSYAAMILTDWKYDSDHSSAQFGFGDTAFYVRVASMVATFALFQWTSWAPTLFPDREFKWSVKE